MTFYDIHYSLTWLKKKIKLLGLHRRGQRVCYTPVSVVKAAIHVSTATMYNNADIMLCRLK